MHALDACLVSASTYSQVPIKRVGPNKREGWVFCKKIRQRVGLNKGKSRKAVPNKRVGWEKVRIGWA